MKFIYPDFKTVTFNNQRWYQINENCHYPSITTVLGHSEPEHKKAALAAWAKSVGIVKAEKIGKDAAARGTSVHLLIEQFIRGDEINFTGITHVEKSIFNSLKMKLKMIDEVWGNEVALYSDTIGVAGRCDCIGVYRGEPSIIDFKTSTRTKKVDQIDDYKLQCAAYALMHNFMHETTISKGVILMGVENGLPLEFRFDIESYIEPLLKRIEIFYDKLPK